MYLQKKDMIKPLGQGFRIIGCEGIDISTPENAKIIDEIVSNAKRIRGEIISKSIDVEFFLDEIIGLFFNGANQKQLDIFNECILQKEFFTFGEKVKVFSFLLKNHSTKFHLESDDKRKELITIIRNVMECRNKFAHEEIVVNFKERTAYILDNNQQNLLSSHSVGEFQHQIIHLSMAYLALYTNLAIEITKESQEPTTK
jgi:abortive infection bacteriophage resistance protein